MEEKDKINFAVYEYSETFAGVLTHKERDEIDALRFELHSKCYKYSRGNMNKLEEITRNTIIAIKDMEINKKEK